MPTWRREKFVLSINELRAHALALARAAPAAKYNAAMRPARSGSRNGFEIKQLRRRGRSQRCYTPAREKRGVRWARARAAGAGRIGASSSRRSRTSSWAGTCKPGKPSLRNTAISNRNPAGLKNISYEIKSAAVDASNKTTAVFKVLVDGAAATLKAPAAGMANPLAGFTGGPTFLLAYSTDASATDGVAAPADCTNAEVKQARAIGASLASLLDTTRAADGSLSGPDANGYYTATLLGTGTKKFPVGAKMRAVALQGYFTQVSPIAARHAISVVKEVTGDAVRRTVVDPEKCSNCHEWFEGHGGNRVYQTQVCMMCRAGPGRAGPDLATSGRQIPDTTMNTWNFTGELLKIVNFWMFDKAAPQAALKLPVTTNNF